MAHKEFPTADADAFSNFIQGRALFQEYLGNGSGDELNQAKDHFATAAARDPNFDIANLYLAVTQTELRDTGASIPALEALVRKGRYLPEAHVQLAYAHIKRYTDGDFGTADAELSKAEHVARSESRNDLLGLIKAYRVFLFAVRGGRGREISMEQRKAYLNEALTLGSELLGRSLTGDGNDEDGLAVQFEVNNALGIAYLWLGEWFPSDPRSANAWVEAENFLRSALALRPRSVRVLQNLGLLFMLRGDRKQQTNSPGAAEIYSQAKDFVAQSLKLNPFDQYPHFQMALLSIKTDDWENAKKYEDAGKKQKGAVPDNDWDLIETAIYMKDAVPIVSVR